MLLSGSHSAVFVQKLQAGSVVEPHRRQRNYSVRHLPTLRMSCMRRVGSCTQHLLIVDPALRSYQQLARRMTASCDRQGAGFDRLSKIQSITGSAPAKYSRDVNRISTSGSNDGTDASSGRIWKYLVE